VDFLVSLVQALASSIERSGLLTVFTVDYLVSEAQKGDLAIFKVYVELLCLGAEILGEFF
jgi:hypothetical protein